jgi:hypothetical protein
VREYRREEHRQHVQEGVGVQPVPEDVSDDLRRLVYTTHVWVERDRWSCTVCGNERRF